jgi:hypothetical protein
MFLPSMHLSAPSALFFYEVFYLRIAKVGRVGENLLLHSDDCIMLILKETT